MELEVEGLWCSRKGEPGKGLSKSVRNRLPICGWPLRR
jgi:hypothetical protein